MKVEELIEQLRYHDDEAVITDAYGHEIVIVYEEENEDGSSIVVLG